MKKFNLIYLKMMVMMLCAIVGVGFVSGAEIYQFFARFEKFSIASLIVFFALMFLLIYKLFCKSNKIENDVKMNNFNKKYVKNTFLIKFKIKSFLTDFNLLLVSSAMFAGLFVVIKNLFNHNYYFVGILIIVFVFLILFFGAKGLQKFDFVVICFVGFIFFHFAYMLIFDAQNFEFDFSNANAPGNLKTFATAILFASLYVFMNIVQIQPIISEFDGKIGVKKRWLLPLLFSTSLSILLAVFVCFMFKIFSLKNHEMPFLEYFKLQGGGLYFAYVVGLILALLSSLLTCLLGVKKWVEKRVQNSFLATGISILLSMIVSLIGFLNFISIIYPIIGVVNFIIFIFL